MDWDAIGAIGELLAAVATIATLTFLAMQIRQSNKAARTTAEIELPQRFAEWTSRVSADPVKMRIWDAAAADFEGLAPEESRQFRWIAADLFLVFEAQYYAFKGGILSEPSWSIKRDTVLGLLENPVIREQWDKRFTPFSEEFRAEIEAHRGSPVKSWAHQVVGRSSGSDSEDLSET
jgi:hypothetical protein